jgi:PTH1 family peptidyl-tRNA hydrolase
MKLIVGLGNPGKEYEKTRHNAGFMVLDEIARRLGGDFCDLSRWEAATLEANINGEKIVFMKPLTYMNVSGRAVGKFADYYKLDPEKDIWVVTDDLDMPLGRIRIRHEGSSGGQNGLKSIIEAVGTDLFSRIRLGISQEITESEPEASIYVLQQFEKREQTLAQRVVVKAADVILDGLNQGTLTAHTLEIE